MKTFRRMHIAPKYIKPLQFFNSVDNFSFLLIFLTTLSGKKNLPPIKFDELNIRRRTRSFSCFFIDRSRGAWKNEIWPDDNRCMSNNDSGKRKDFRGDISPRVSTESVKYCLEIRVNHADENLSIFQDRYLNRFDLLSSLTCFSRRRPSRALYAVQRAHTHTHTHIWSLLFSISLFQCHSILVQLSLLHFTLESVLVE